MRKNQPEPGKSNEKDLLVFDAPSIHANVYLTLPRLPRGATATLNPPSILLLTPTNASPSTASKQSPSRHTTNKLVWG
eukprot:m.126883 g.126883  ORF g.126883 m.126883 type:complete len:78 (-) comp13585_c0_seq4:3-236(-)